MVKFSFGRNIPYFPPICQCILINWPQKWPNLLLLSMISFETASTSLSSKKIDMASDQKCRLRVFDKIIGIQLNFKAYSYYLFFSTGRDWELRKYFLKVSKHNNWEKKMYNIFKYKLDICKKLWRSTIQNQESC